ncbi:MAG TPA: NnrU family protein [Planctomycetota bacterium]
MTTAPSSPAPRGTDRGKRRVAPVSESFDAEDQFDPAVAARPLAAGVLLVGPILAAVGVLGWMRLVGGVPLLEPPAFDLLGLLLDLLLLLLFLVPHSLLARGFGRRWLNRPLGPEAERPLYVLAAGATLTLMVFAWSESGPVIWNHAGMPAYAARAVQGAGLLLLGWALLVKGADNLLGIPHLRALETGRKAQGEELTALPPYRWMRHPMNVGFLLLMAGMPEVTLDRALLAGVTGAWILLSAPFEERDAGLTFGRSYRAYKERTPRWWPRFRRQQDQ